MLLRWFSPVSRFERKAVHAFRLKRYHAALRHLDALLEHIGENPNTLHIIALCHERLGADDTAFKYAIRSITVDADHIEALRLLIRVHIRRDEMDAARDLAKRALARLQPVPEPRGLGRFSRWSGWNRDPVSIVYDRELREWIQWAQTLVDADPTHRQ